jgi:hypothetical protein
MLCGSIASILLLCHTTLLQKLDMHARNCVQNLLDPDVMFKKNEKGDDNSAKYIDGRYDGWLWYTSAACGHSGRSKDSEARMD